MSETATLSAESQTAIALSHAKSQRTFAMIVFGFSFSLLLIVSAVTLYTQPFGSEMVFTTITTLVGTWVGTLLAFFYSRENFESASRSMQDTINKLSPDEKMRSVPIVEAMLRRDEISAIEIKKGQAAATVPLADFGAKFASTEITRLPIFNDDGSIFGVLHEREYEKYLNNNANVASPTLGNLLADPALAKQIKLFGIVAANRTLRDAKSAMESQKDCRDVFVTQSGAAGDKVLGWITNVGILARLDA